MTTMDLVLDPSVLGYVLFAAFVAGASAIALVWLFLESDAYREFKRRRDQESISDAYTTSETGLF